MEKKEHSRIMGEATQLILDTIKVLLSKGPIDEAGQLALQNSIIEEHGETLGGVLILAANGVVNERIKDEREAKGFEGLFDNLSKRGTK